MKRIASFLLIFTMIISNFCFTASASEGEGYVYRNNTFDYNFAPEPMHVTDEDFFGQWDSVNGVWVQEPDLNYERFPALADVERAAKAGDYAAAKVAIKAYYVPKKDSKVSKLKANDAAIMEAKMAERNIHAVRTTGDIIGFVEGATTEWKELSSTAVLPFVQTVVSQNNPYITFAVASVDKSNTPAEIKSRITDNPPTLTIVADGIERTFVACEDTYISPTLNADKNYGGEEILYAQEYGYTSHWSDPTAPWGDEASDTRRALIKFNITGIKSSANITSATFNFTTRVSAGGDLTEKELMLYSWNDSTWDEMNVTWNSYTDWLFFSCNEQDSWTYRMSYSTTKKGKMCYYHRGGQPANVARMYSATGDEKYAHSFLRHMSHLLYYVGVSSDYMNALDMSNHIANVGTPFIQCWDSEYMTPELFTAFLKHFSRMTDFIIVNYLDKDSHWNNWASNQTGSTYWACMMFPEFAHADYWYEKTLFHNKKLFKTFTFEDGVCIEQGLGYVGTILGTINRAIEVYNDFSENPPYGIFMDEDGANMILNIVKNMYYSLAPGYGGFDLSDSMDYGKSYKSTITSWYKKLVKLGIDDEDLKYVATNGAKGKLPDFTSISYPYANRTYMRTSWDADAIAMAITAKGGSASHKHRDIMSVSMYAYGQYLLIDSSYGAVLTGDMFSYMSAPQRHNTLTINGGDIKNGKSYDSVTKEVEINDNYNYVTYSNAHFENASNVERTVMFPKNEKFFIITDYVVPSNQTEVNTVEQYWHMHPSAKLSITKDGKNEFRSNFESGANVIVSPVDSASFKDVTKVDSLYAPDYGTFIEHKNGMYVKETYGPTSFGTIIYPLEEGEDRIIDTVPIDTGIADNGAVAFEINITDPATGEVEKYVYYHLNRSSKKSVVKIGKYATDATTLLVREDDNGNILSYFVYDCSYFECDDINSKNYLYSSDSRHTFGADYGEDYSLAISSDELSGGNLEGTSFYVQSENAKVSLNGEVIEPLMYYGSVQYFGDSMTVNTLEDSVKIVGWDGDSPVSSEGHISISYMDSVYRETANSSAFSKMSSYTSSGRAATIETDTDGTKYISTEYGGYKSNSRGGELYDYITTTDEATGTVTDSKTPVLSFKTVMRVPEGANLTTDRQVYMSFEEGKQINLYCKQLDDGNGGSYLGISVEYSGNVTNVNKIPFEYKEGEWVTIEARIYRNSDGTLTIGGYANDKQIYYAEGTEKLYSDTMQVNVIGLYNGRTSPVAVDYKEISVSAIDDTYIPADKVNEYIDENDKKIVFFNFENVRYPTATSKLMIANSIGDVINSLKIDLDSHSDLLDAATYATSDSEISPKSGRSFFVSTNADTDAEGSLILNQYTQKSMSSYIDASGETVLKLYYDIYIPSASKGSKRSVSLKMTTDTDSYSNCNFSIDSIIQNEKLTFKVTENSDVAQGVPLACLTQTADISTDTWHTVENIIKITPDSTGFTMKIYGILDNVCYYVNECNFTTSNLAVCNFPDISIFGTGTGLANIKTGFDNIGLSKLLNYTTDSFTNGLVDTPHIYPLSLTYDSGIAEAKVNLPGYGGDFCLVMTIHDTNGIVKKVYTDTSIESGYLSCTSKVSDVEIKSGYKVKAFLFDSISSAVPYVEDVCLEID